MGLCCGAGVLAALVHLEARSVRNWRVQVGSRGCGCSRQLHTWALLCACCEVGAEGLALALTLARPPQPAQPPTQVRLASCFPRFHDIFTSDQIYDHFLPMAFRFLSNSAAAVRPVAAEGIACFLRSADPHCFAWEQPAWFAREGEGAARGLRRAAALSLHCL